MQETYKYIQQLRKYDTAINDNPCIWMTPEEAEEYKEQERQEEEARQKAEEEARQQQEQYLRRQDEGYRSRYSNHHQPLISSSYYSHPDPYQAHHNYFQPIHHYYSHGDLSQYNQGVSDFYGYDNGYRDNRSRDSRDRHGRHSNPYRHDDRGSDLYRRHSFNESHRNGKRYSRR